MKKLLLFITIITTTLSCNNNDDNNDPVDSSTDIDITLNWNIEQFNTDYTIKFPENYSGGIIQQEIGTTFEKTKNDNKVVVSGGFCNPAAYPCLANDFNIFNEDSIIESDIDSIPYTNNEGELAYYNQKTTILIIMKK